ncbi:MAG TPA: class I SAM-dependent methyltransferase [Azospirillum sp.]|nr:class I SAM-dependent methyltransferase [Azospirillum sp.]
MTALEIDPGSFRDPAGRVVHLGGRIYRTIAESAAGDYEFLSRRGVLDRLRDEGWIVPAEEVNAAILGDTGLAAHRVVEHPCLPFISYPYEWPFGALKAAALFHLDLHLRALDEGVTLSDASAYNVQFRAGRPVFIDLLSLRRYREGEFWLGHRQFCEQFLNPLLLRAYLGVPHNAWFRGNLEGIPTADLARLLPRWRVLSWRVLLHVVLPGRFQAQAAGRTDGGAGGVKRRQLPLPALRGMLKQLRSWIATLEPGDSTATVWGNYEETHTYAEPEEQAKRRMVAEFVAHAKPNLMWDLGCNTGAYSALALEAGAGTVVGFDFDQGALERAFARTSRGRLDFLPLFLDAANPSPDQGWNGTERMGFGRRATADALMALAFEHHLAIGRNIPMDQLVSWLIRLAPCGLIEFVQKSDPTVQRMLSLRDDIFPDYTEEVFAALLARQARIVRVDTVSAAGRRLYWYDRSR